jgi:hypothetical protein
MIPLDHPKGGEQAHASPSLRSGVGADECVRPYTNKTATRGGVDVTFVTSRVSKLLDRVRRSEDYAVNFFQRNSGF